MHSPEVDPVARDAKATRRLLVVSVGAIVVIVYVIWFFVLRQDSARESSRHRTAISTLERELAVFRVQNSSVIEYGARARELDAEIAAMRTRIAALSTSAELTPAESERLAALDRYLLEADEHFAKLEAVAVARDQAAANAPKPREPRRILLEDYARETTGSPDVRRLGFSPDAARRFYLYEQIDSETGERKLFVSKERDGKNAMAFALPNSLTTHHTFKPLTPTIRESALATLIELQKQFTEPIDTTIYMCPGIIACDALVNEIRQLCEQAGMKVSIINRIHESDFPPRLRTSIGNVQQTRKWFDDDSGFMQALQTISNISVQHMTSGFASTTEGRKDRPNIVLSIQGFPQFNDDGYATFDK